MKTRIKIVLGAALAAPVFAFGLVNAQMGHMEVLSEQTEQTTKPEPTAEQKEALLKERLEKRKEDLKLKLTNAEQVKIKARCQASQGKLSSLEGRIKGIETSRDKVYGNISNKLAGLVAKLKEHEVDTADLEAQITALNELINSYKTDLEDYKQVVADLADMDCATDPTAYKASLESARSLRTKVHKDAADIRKFINDSIKPALAKVRDEVKQKREADEGSN